VQDTVRQRTYERYESIARVHIKPAIGRLKLKALTPAHARALYRQKLDSGLAPRSVNYMHVTLHKALSQAVSDGLVPRNAAKVKAPRPEKPEIRPLSSDQARKLIKTAHETGDRYAALYVVALHTGLREGEMLGLRWDDLDLEATTPTLQVRRTLSETRSGHKFELPKNGKGRSIKLSRKAVEALRSHRARQAEEKLRLGSLAG
jgi:integrase